MGAALDLPPGFAIRWLAEVDSTNDEARRLAEAGAHALTLVWAERQNGGRGRRGRAWMSPPGNLYCSLLLRPGVTAAAAAEVSFIAALAVAETVSSLLPVGRNVSCKWPNDVLVEGRKISGILLESRVGSSAGRVEWLILGTGLNIASFPQETEYPATSLHEAGGVAGAAEVLETYAARLSSWLARWEAQGFAPVRQSWLRWAEGLGRRITVRLADARLEGIFSALDPSGALVLELADGTRRLITAGDVFPADR